MKFSLLTLIFLLALNCVGCDQSKSVKEEEVAFAQEGPEEQLDWAMERLRRTLDSNESLAGTGLRVKSELEYEYLPSTDEQPETLAVVSIKTTSAFLHRGYRKPKPKQTRPLGYFDEDDPLNEPGPDATLEELKEYNSSKWLVSPDDEVMEKADLSVAATVPPRKQKETSVFQLIYKEDRWQLVEQPESKYQQGLFEYALEE